jgi:small subunit ribosomal protein S1
MKSNTTRSQPAKASFSMDDFAKALEEQDFEFNKGQIVRGKVYEYDSEGAYVDIGGKSLAFIPLREASVERVTDISQVLPLQEERDFLIIRESNADGQVTLSIRQLELQRVWDELGELQESGQSITAYVTGVNKGGVTVDAKGLRGFIPRSHLVERNNLDRLVGHNLSVSIIEANSDTKKLVLSQRLVAQAQRVSTLQVGDLVEGEITNIKPFGLFVDLEGVTALLHIKQISQNYIASLPSLFKVGQSIKAVIVEIDEWKNRISLSTRVLENYPGEFLEKMPEVMAEAETRAKNIGKQAVENEPVSESKEEPVES